MGSNCPAAAVFIAEANRTLELISIRPPLWEVKSASAEIIPELALKLYEALLALDNGYCQTFLLRLS